MKSVLGLLTLSLSFLQLYAQKEIPSKEVQIKTALLAAPAEQRDGSSVYGYDTQGKLILLKKGTNELICLADDPKQEGFSAACYHRDLDPFMARGRELRLQGKSQKEITDIREAEAKSGKLAMPKHPSTLYVYSAEPADFDPKSGDVRNGAYRYVIYIPYATAASTGLTTKPEVKGMPWLMDPGKARAHIMITP